MSTKTLKKKNGRPAVQVYGAIRARAIRGPNGDAWYWRAERHVDSATETVWSGWATLAELPDVLGAVASVKPAKAPEVPSVLVTARDLLEHWYAGQNAREDIRAKTKVVDRYFADQLCDGLGTVPLRTVGFGDLERYRDTRLRAGAATRTVEHEIRKFGQAWRWGRRRRLVPDREIDLPKIRVTATRPKRTPTRDEARCVLAAMDPTTWPYVATLIIAHTGLRIHEVAALRWRDLRLDGPEPVLNVPDRTKTGWRLVPITPAVATVLRAWRGRARGDERVFKVVEGTILTSLSQRYIPAACEAAGVERFTPHALRRMVVDSLYDAGVEPATAGTITGHSPLTALRNYRGVAVERRRSAMALAGLDLLNVLPLGGLAATSHTSGGAHTDSRTLAENAG